MIITIDGPAASGKSTVARIVAEKLGFYYICSGYLYRALAYLLVAKKGYTEQTIHSVQPEDIAACFDPLQFAYHYQPSTKEHIVFDKEDITAYLKDSTIDRIASITSVNEYVRHYVTVLQHSLAEGKNVVVDGRDVGSAVFPYADIKFYLTASMDIRAQRWRSDQNMKGHHFSLQEAIEKLTSRDRRDQERSTAPLIIPDGALVIDTSLMTLDEVYEKMLTVVYEKKS
jgi:cytidylate kinase